MRLPGKFLLPAFYPILDAGVLARAGLSLESFARELRAAGVRFLQYRDKDSSDDLVCQRATLLRAIFPAADSTLILNDRAHLLPIVGFEGVHLGQEDQTPEAVRGQLGEGVIIGLSTHNEPQLLRAQQSAVDYLAIGPVFATGSKANPDPVIGLAGVREARGLTGLSLVAIGGITRGNRDAVRTAGADSVAVLSDLLPRPGRTTEQIVEDYLRIP